jgi:hypothetical protein
MSAAGLSMVVTFFDNEAAQTKSEERCTISTLAARIYSATASVKTALPWLKAARFGDHRSKQNSLRTNDNVAACTGIEADYDAGKVSFQAAVDCLRRAGIACIVYTSPSYTPEFPKYGVICPFSRELPPGRRRDMLGRLAGLLAEIGVEFAPESWTLSQSYYYGSVANNRDHQVVDIDGMPIDLRDDLDAIRKDKPGGGSSPITGRRPVITSDVSDARLDGLLRSLRGRLSEAAEGQKHDTLLRIARTIGGYAHLFGLGDDQLVSMMLDALPGTVLDWNSAEKTARDGLAYGRASPLDLEDRPLPPRRTNSAPPDDDQAEEPPPADPEYVERLEADADADGHSGAGSQTEGSPPGSSSAQQARVQLDDTSVDVLTEIAKLGPNLTLKKLVAIFNQKYAVTHEAGKAVVIWAVRDPLLQRDGHERASFPDFKRLYQNHTLGVVVKDKDGKDKTVTKCYADWWLDNPHRRQYLDGVVFDPAGRASAATLNLWRGWNVTPTPGDWSLMREHIDKIICGGRADIYDYGTHGAEAASRRRNRHRAAWSQGHR